MNTPNELAMIGEVIKFAVRSTWLEMPDEKGD